MGRSHPGESRPRRTRGLPEVLDKGRGGDQVERFPQRLGALRPEGPLEIGLRGGP